MYKNNKISIVIPCYNEEEGIAYTLRKIPDYVDEIVVVDNNSTDNTSKVAEKLGAKVVLEKRQGYGNAYKKGFKVAKGDIIITGDGDGTYPLEHSKELLKILIEENLDFISGCRFPLKNKKSMLFLNKIGNLILNIFMSILCGKVIKDSQSGMWIFRKKILKGMKMISTGMSFSEEIKMESVLNFHFKEISIDYHPRTGETKLNRWKDGLINMFFLLKKFWLMRKKEFLLNIIVVLILVGSSFEVYRLILLKVAPPLWDEGQFINEGFKFYQLILHHKIKAFISLTNEQAFYPFLHKWLVGLWGIFFGYTIKSIKSLSIVYYCFSAILIFKIGNIINRGKKIESLFSTFLFLSSPLVIFISTTALIEPLGLLLSILSFYTYFLAKEKNILWMFILTGFLTSLALLTKYNYGILLITVFFISFILDLVFDGKVRIKTYIINNLWLFGVFLWIFIHWLFLGTEKVGVFLDVIRNSTDGVWFPSSFYKRILFYPMSFITSFHFSYLLSAISIIALSLSIKQFTKNSFLRSLIIIFFLNLILGILHLDNQQERYLFTSIFAVFLISGYFILNIWNFFKKIYVKLKFLRLPIIILTLLSVAYISIDFYHLPELAKKVGSHSLGSPMFFEKDYYDSFYIFNKDLWPNQYPNKDDDTTWEVLNFISSNVDTDKPYSLLNMTNEFNDGLIRFTLDSKRKEDNKKIKKTQVKTYQIGFLVSDNSIFNTNDFRRNTKVMMNSVLANIKERKSQIIASKKFKYLNIEVLVFAQ